VDFYDEIAGNYDDITGAASRTLAAKAFVSTFLARYRVASALDVACGNGLYAIALAHAAVRVVGSDLSAAMLAQAARRAEAAGVAVQWMPAPMQDLPDKLAGPFDAVLCMGNSIPHLLSDADLEATIAGFTRLTAPGGRIVLNLLHYARLLAANQRIVGVDRHGQTEYVRFYDFLDAGRIRFNILTVDWSGEEPAHRLHSTTLRPYSWAVLRDSLLRHGCGEVEAFAGLRFEPFNPDRSDTVTLVGRKE
jgi:SAM-dependent methyltransferase